MRLRAVAVLSVLASLPTGNPVGAGQYPGPPKRDVLPVDDSRIDRVFRWVNAVETHRPGTADEALGSIRAWSGTILGTLFTDATTLVQIIADPRKSEFSVRVSGTRLVDIGYTKAQLVRLRELACAAGDLRVAPCQTIRPDQRADLVLARLAAHAASARQAGDRNYFVRRASMLHTDIATLTAPAFVAGSGDPALVRQPVGVYEGIVGHVVDTSVHWVPARAMVDWVVHEGITRPAPDRDPWVRAWYCATAAWMLGHKRYRTEHLDRAREIFPDDPDFLNRRVTVKAREGYIAGP